MRYLLFCLLLCVWSCKKERVSESPAQNAPSPEILWQAPLMPHAFSGNATLHCLIDGGIVLSPFDSAVPTSIQMRDTSTGELRWTFNQFAKPVYIFDLEDIQPLHNKVIAFGNGITYCIDGKSGMLDWQIDNPLNQYAPYISCIGDYVYQSANFNNNGQASKGALIRSHYTNGYTDTLVSIFTHPGSNIEVFPPALWINHTGDSILIFKDQQFWVDNAGNFNESVGLHAWNLTTQEFEWELSNFQNEESLIGAKVVVFEDQLFFESEKFLYCLNAGDGSLAWKYAYYNGHDVSNILPTNNILVINGNSLEGIDIHTGKRIWSSSMLGSFHVNFGVYENVCYYLYTANNALFAVNISTGQIQWGIKTPINKASNYFNGSIVVDSGNGDLYVADNYYLLRYRLPKP